ncbi:MAG: hypothetical protein JXA03_14445 [Bacteroidales bacterium]|nr:hypothetical protein [Bacteroidales bacterium]
MDTRAWKGILAGCSLISAQWLMFHEPVSGQGNWILDHYTLGAGIGSASFYGDLSVYDNDLSKKLSLESGPGTSLWASKSLFGDRLLVCGQVLYGSFQAQTPNQSFSAEILEYNLHFGIELTEVFFRGKDFPFRFYPFAGAGHFFFDSRSKWKNEMIRPPSGKTEVTIKTKVPEFVYFFGGRASYDIGKDFSLTAEMGIRQARNDKLDTLRDKDLEITWDYYLFSALGISYRFNLRKPGNIDTWVDEFQKKWEP